MSKSKITICRCEDITLEEIEEAIEDHGFTTVDELKRYLRLGMGACQGRTCIPLAMRILARRYGIDVEDVYNATVRPPVVPVPLGAIAHDPEVYDEVVDLLDGGEEGNGD